MVNSFEEYVSDYHRRYRQFYEHPQEAYLEPFRIYGNLYYVGDKKACMDLIDAAKEDPGQGHFLERVESRNGRHTIEAAAELGFGSRDYELIEL